MDDASNRGSADPSSAIASRGAELFVFLTIAALVWPIVAVGIVGGYGFLVWMSQIAFGPPGPPQ